MCFSKSRSDFIINIKILFQGGINECNMGSQKFLEGIILILLTSELWLIFYRRKRRKSAHSDR